MEKVLEYVYLNYGYKKIDHSHQFLDFYGVVFEVKQSFIWR